MVQIKTTGKVCVFKISVVDSPPDPYVFGPPGSVPVHHYLYGSGSFNHQAKIVRKTLISTVFLLLYDFLSLKSDLNVPSKSNKKNN